MTSLGQATRAILDEGDPRAKLMLTRAVRRDWMAGRLFPAIDVAMPDRPARPERPELLPPNRMAKRGRMGSATGRLALIHALAHIEFVAIDLAVDLVGRFADRFPPAFADDFLKVAADEAMHHALLDRRLKQLGAAYGDLPAHDGLWEACAATAHDPLARLAVVPLVLEARGLDVTPQTVARLEAAGDHASARILGRILHDEIAHVAAGVRWFRHGCAEAGLEPERHWQHLVRTYFKGVLKAPFNDSARIAAGLTPDFYAPIAEPALSEQ